MLASASASQFLSQPSHLKTLDNPIPVLKSEQPTMVLGQQLLLSGVPIGDRWAGRGTANGPQVPSSASILPLVPNKWQFQCLQFLLLLNV